MKEIKQNTMWVADLLEDEWYAASADVQAALISAVKARMHAAGCSRVLIFVTPDALFSSIEQRGRHKVFEYVHPVAPGEAFKLEALFTCTVAADRFHDLADMRAKEVFKVRCRDALVRAARGVAGRYVIQVSDGTSTVEIERGRV